MKEISPVLKLIILTGFFISLFSFGNTVKAAEVECRMDFNMKSWDLGVDVGNFKISKINN